MFFTQDDYKKIQQWLIRNSVKDTEFNEANIPFNGEETITIVQGNQNKKVFLKDLVSQVFNLGISDFVNITDKYDAPNINLEEAIRLIPSKARKKGQVITFLNKEDSWNIYQFKGVLNQWNVLDKWEDLFSWDNISSDHLLPDEEDLTKSLPDENGNSYLSLKNRKYEPENYSGLGRIILRNNIIKVEDPIYGKVEKNILYQEMFTQSNTIYEIRYDFDLNGEEITIPEDCILDFQGGSFSNGTIIGNNTSVNAKPIKIFDNTYGSWNIEYAYAEWFGAVADGVTDCYDAITKALSMTPKNCHLLRGTYAVSKTISLGYKYKLSGQQGPTTSIIPTEGADMDSIILIGTSKDGSTAVANGYLKDVGIYNSPKDGISCVYVTQGFNIENVEVKNCGEAGLRVVKCWYAAFRNINSWHNKYGIVVSVLQDGTNYSQVNGIGFDNCWLAHNTENSVLIHGANAVSFSNCTFEGAGNIEICVNRLYHDISLYNCYMETTAQGIYVGKHVESGSSFNIFGGYYIFRPKEDKYPIEISTINVFNINGGVLLVLDKTNLQKAHLIYSEASLNYIVAAIRDNIKSIEATGKVIEPFQNYRYNDGIFYGCDARTWQTNNLRITHDGSAVDGSTANFFLGLNRASNIKYSEGIRGFAIDHTTTGDRTQDSVNFKIQLGTSDGKEGSFRNIFKVNYLGYMEILGRLKGNIAPNSGTSEERPSYKTGYKGLMFFDTTLGKPIYMKADGVWVDATGAEV